VESISRNIEDYLEVIYRLIESDRLAAMSIIADEMNVSRPSVTQIVSKMVDIGLVRHEPYGDVTLTEKGRTIAKSVSRRHRLFSEFLHDILGVQKEIADKEACKLEHAIGLGTTERLAAFVRFVSASEESPEWLVLFKEYAETNRFPEVCIKCPRFNDKPEDR
jgi:DtxR family Mn-dependent transcriptional regulator